MDQLSVSLLAIGFVAALVGVTYRGIVRRLDDEREKRHRQTELIQDLQVGQTRMEGLVVSQGAELGGRIDVLAQRQLDANGRQGKTERAVDAIEQRNSDALNRLLMSHRRVQEAVQVLLARIPGGGVMDALREEWRAREEDEP